MRKVFFLLLAFLLLIPATAQDFTANQSIELVPFMVEKLDVQGLRPRGWREQPNGVYVRARDPLDLTAILLQSRAGTMAELLTDLQTEFALPTAPSLVETVESPQFTWSLYQFERQQSNQSLITDVAFAEDTENGRVYYVLLQTTELFHEALHTELFLPAVQALSPIQRYVDPAGRFDVPIPSFWTLEEHEAYALLQDADNSIRIYVSAVAGDDVPAAMQAFWLSIYPDFALELDPASDINSITDPSRIGGLERVDILNWQRGEDVEGHIKQGVARIYNGTIYMTLIETSTAMVLEHNEAIALVDNNYRITALLPEASPEATQGS